MKKFKTPVAMEVTQEQYDRDLKQPLKDLGYVESCMGRPTESYTRLKTNWVQSNNGLGISANQNECHLIPTYNPELFLALAGMTEGDNQTKEQLINHFSKEVMEDKKYRIKEQYKLAFQNTWHDAILTLEQWKANGLSIEALEEVEQRVELRIHRADKYFLVKKTDWTDQEKDLCEKAINGELLDVESLDSDDFEEWYKKAENCNVYYNSDYEICGIKAVLKEYLKQR